MTPKQVRVMAADLHSGNVMKDEDTEEYIMTDPFSFVD